jgi:tRNA(fMet)-specific endonuclease VapC
LKRSAYVEKVIELFPIYNFEVSIARIYAALWSDLSRRGIQIGAHDLIIGSTAISLGFSVATYNLRHFERIEGLKIETFNNNRSPSPRLFVYRRERIPSG